MLFVIYSLPLLSIVAACQYHCCFVFGGVVGGWRMMLSCVFISLSIVLFV